MLCLTTKFCYLVSTISKLYAQFHDCDVFFNYSVKLVSTDQRAAMAHARRYCPRPQDRSAIVLALGGKPNFYCEAIELVCDGSPNICVFTEWKFRHRVKLE